MRAKVTKIILLFCIAMCLSSPLLMSTAEAYFNTYGPYYSFIDPYYAASAYTLAYLAPPEVIPYRSASALLTTLALLGVLPTTSTSLLPTTYPTYTTYSTIGIPTPTPSYSIPTYSTTPSIGLATVLLLGGSTSTTTLLALGI